MTRTTPWREIRRQDITPEAREKARVIQHAIEDALALGELRKTREIKQVEVAARMGVDQGAVSRLERREDLYLSTLRDYVEALGGKLDLLARFPDGHQVLIEAKAPESPTILRARTLDGSHRAAGIHEVSRALGAIQEVSANGHRAKRKAAGPDLNRTR